MSDATFPVDQAKLSASTRSDRPRSWLPLRYFCKGKVLKSWKSKHSARVGTSDPNRSEDKSAQTDAESHLPYRLNPFIDVCIGDDVYVFEIHKSGKWGRAYVFTLPDELSYLHGSIVLDETYGKSTTEAGREAERAKLEKLYRTIDHSNMKVGVVPLSVLHVTDHIDIPTDSLAGSNLALPSHPESSDKAGNIRARESSVGSAGSAGSVRSARSIGSSASIGSTGTPRSRGSVSSASGATSDTLNPANSANSANSTNSTNSAPRKDSSVSMTSATETHKFASLYELEQAENTGKSKPHKPALPYIHSTRRKVPPLREPGPDLAILEDIRLTLQKWYSSYFFRLYVEGDYTVFTRLAGFIQELMTLYVKFEYNFFTAAERRAAYNRAIYLLNAGSKLLNYSHTTGGGGRSPLAEPLIVRRRASGPDAEDSGTKPVGPPGELCAADKDYPPDIAREQVLMSLSQSYPTESSTEEIDEKQGGYKPSDILVDFKAVAGDESVTGSNFTAYLYLRNKNRRITQSFAVHINRNSDFSLSQISAALFKNIPAAEFVQGKIYLVAMLTEELPVPRKPARSGKWGSAPPPPRRVRRGVAAGAADISRIFRVREGVENEFVIRLYSSFFTRRGPSRQNRGWGDLVERIITGAKEGVATNPRVDKIVVSVKEFRGRAANAPFVSTDSIAAIPSLFFSPTLETELAQESDTAYVHIGAVELENRGRELRLGVNDSITIQLVPSSSWLAFRKAANDPTAEYWNTIAVRPGEMVGEVLRVHGLKALLNSPATATAQDHIVARAFVNGECVAQGRMLLRDGRHIHDSGTGSARVLLGDGHEGALISVELRIQYIGRLYNVDPTVEKLLSWKAAGESRKLLPASELSQLLQATTFIDLQQFLRSYSELILAELEIMAVMGQQNEPEVEYQAFAALVHLLDVLLARQPYYVYLLGEFIAVECSELQRLPFVWRGLLRCMVRGFNAGMAERDRSTRALCRVAGHVVRLAAACVADDTRRSEFSAEFRSVCAAAAEFLAHPKDELLLDKCALVEWLYDWGNHVENLVAPEIVVAELVRLVDAVAGTAGGDTGSVRSRGSIRSGQEDESRAPSREKKLRMARLLLVQRLAGWAARCEPTDLRTELVRQVFGWAAEGMVGGAGVVLDLQELRLVAAALAAVLRPLTIETVAPAELPEALALFVPLVRTFGTVAAHVGQRPLPRRRTFTTLYPNSYPFPIVPFASAVPFECFSEVAVELLVLVATVLRLARRHKAQLAVSVSELPEFVKSCGQLWRTAGVLYPRTWFSVHGIAVRAALDAFVLTAPLLLRHTIPPATAPPAAFDASTWHEFLAGIVAVAKSREISCYEAMSIVERVASAHLAGDVRGEAAELLGAVWPKLGWPALPDDVAQFRVAQFGGWQVIFSDTTSDMNILPGILACCVANNAALQLSCIRMLWSMLISDWSVSATLEGFERDCLKALKRVYDSLGHVPPAVATERFVTLLKTVTIVPVNSGTLSSLDSSNNAGPSDVSDPPAAFGVAVRRTIETLTEFLSVLHDRHAVPPTSSYREDAVFHTLNVLGFFVYCGEPELFEQYAAETVRGLQKRSEPVQIGLVFELVASLYDWDRTEVPSASCLELPRQTAFQRKECLLLKALESFTEGRHYRKALQIGKQLAAVYERRAFDLLKTANMHMQLCKLYNKLESDVPHTPSYFRVSYIGNGFPAGLQNRQFIFEGLPYEKLSSIYDRLLRQHPGAVVVSAERDAQPFGRYLHVSVVVPAVDVLAAVFLARHTTRAARDWAQQQDLRRFRLSRPLPGSTSVLDLWVEETVYETYVPFPALMQRAEIQRTSVVLRSPVENAIYALVAKINELTALESSFNAAARKNGGRHIRAGNESLVLELGRNLTGTIDAPVNGGVQQYRQFLSDAELQQDERTRNQLEYLRNSFRSLAACLGSCLQIHEQVVSEQLRPAHQSLVSLYQQNFKEEIAWLAAEAAGSAAGDAEVAAAGAALGALTISGMETSQGFVGSGVRPSSRGEDPQNGPGGLSGPTTPTTPRRPRIGSAVSGGSVSPLKKSALSHQSNSPSAIETWRSRQSTML